MFYLSQLKKLKQDIVTSNNEGADDVLLPYDMYYYCYWIGKNFKRSKVFEGS